MIDKKTNNNNYKLKLINNQKSIAILSFFTTDEVSKILSTPSHNLDSHINYHATITRFRDDMPKSY